MQKTLGFFLILVGVSVSGPALAEAPPIVLKLHDHRFTPEQFEVVAGEKYLIEIENQDNAAEEFESYTLHREKIVPANGKAKVFIGPLKPGRYEFFGEFHSDTARGVVLAK